MTRAPRGSGRVRRAAAATLAAALAIGLAACASTSRLQAPFGQSLTASLDWHDNRFHAADALLRGFDLPVDDPEPAAGDAVLLGVVVSRDGAERVRLLRLTIGPRAEGNRHWGASYTATQDGGPVVVRSPQRRVLVELFDQRGEAVEASSALVPELLLRHGLYGAVAPVPGDPTPIIQADQVPEGLPETVRALIRRRMALGWLGMLEFGRALGQNRALTQLLLEVVRKPPLLSLLGRLSVRLDYGPEGVSGPADVRLTRRLTLPTYRVPVDLYVNDTIALRTVSNVTAPVGPLGACGGLVELEGQHAASPGTRVYVRLLAARRRGPSEDAAEAAGAAEDQRQGGARADPAPAARG